MSSQLQNFYANPNYGSVNGFARKSPVAGTVYYAQLAATTDTTLTVPSIAGVGQLGNNTSRMLAIFGYQNGATVFVANGVTAAVSTSASFAAVNGSINPQCFLVEAGDVLHFYALAQDYVTVEFQAVQ